jgi:hypothetical protein
VSAKESTIETGSGPDSDYTRTWSPSGEIDYLKLADGDRLRYLKAGSGRTALITLHTVRTQLDHFQLVIPQLLYTGSPMSSPVRSRRPGTRRKTRSGTRCCGVQPGCLAGAVLADGLDVRHRTEAGRIAAGLNASVGRNGSNRHARDRRVLSSSSTPRRHKTDTSETTRATSRDVSLSAQTARLAGETVPRVIARVRA